MAGCRDYFFSRQYVDSLVRVVSQSGESVKIRLAAW